MTGTNGNGKLTVMEAYERHFIPQATSVQSTRATDRTALRRWQKLADDPDIRDITMDSLCDFRRAQQAAGCAPDTCEHGVNVVLKVLRHCHRLGMRGPAPWPGQRLKVRSTPKYVPPLADLGAIYASSDAAQWPLWVMQQQIPPGEFWRSFLVVCYWTGLRYGDMVRLQWDGVREDSIFHRAAKTGKVHISPRHPVVDRHLAIARRWATDGRIFPVSQFRKGRMLSRSYSHVRFAVEMKRLCRAAQLPRTFLMHAIRRLATSQWQKAKWGAGEVLHGSALRGVARVYIVPEILQQAAPVVAWPDAVLNDEEREQSVDAEAFEALRSLPAGSLKALLAMARQMGGRT